ncbi:MAG: DUF190 domain-containing protein [Deltaproteobacteria bacterium]|nr:DUF190 domain-containing protein [Deltaproteobacteria bacterium]
MVRALSGEAMLVRIFIGEDDRFRGQPLSTALVERLRREGFAGATVFHGVAGFGARSVLHTTSLLRLSEDLPVVIEIVEEEARVPALEAILSEMMREGLVTLERVRVIRYAPEEAGLREARRGRR